MHHQFTTTITTTNVKTKTRTRTRICYTYCNNNHKTTTINNNQTNLLLLLSQVLAMTMAEPGSRMSLKYKLEGTKGDLGRWGHEYLRSLAGEIGQEYSARRMRIVKADGAGKGEEGEGGGKGGAAKAMDEADGEEADVSDLIELVDDIVPFHLQHNAEAEAVDLLVEVQVNE